MPLPEGASYADRGSRTYVRLSDGSVVRRQEASNIYYHELGFKNEYEYKQSMKAVRQVKEGYGRKAAEARDVYKSDVQAIKKANPSASQKEIDLALARLYQAKRTGEGVSKAAAEWNYLTGRMSQSDWSRY